MVVHRRDEAVVGWRNWLGEDPLVRPYKWLRLDLVPPAPFLQCQPHITPGGSGVLADLARIDEEFRKGLASLLLLFWAKFALEVDGWLLLLREVSFPELTGDICLP